jgi:hypothetical protein
VFWGRLLHITVVVDVCVCCGGGGGGTGGRAHQPRAPRAPGPTHPWVDSMRVHRAVEGSGLGEESWAGGASAAARLMHDGLKGGACVGSSSVCVVARHKLLLRCSCTLGPARARVLLASCFVSQRTVLLVFVDCAVSGCAVSGAAAARGGRGRGTGWGRQWRVVCGARAGALLRQADGARYGGHCAGLAPHFHSCLACRASRCTTERAANACAFCNAGAGVG